MSAAGVRGGDNDDKNDTQPFVLKASSHSGVSSVAVSNKWSTLKRRSNVLLNAVENLKGCKPDVVANNKSKLSASETLMRSPRSKMFVVAIVAIVNTCDLLGEVLTMPIMPYLYQSFPFATQKQINGGLGVFSSEAAKIGLGTTMNVGPSVYVFGALCASLMSAGYHKWIGKRGAFLVWTFGGAVGFLLCGFAGDYKWGIGVFWFFRFATGLFAGGEATLSSYIAEMFPDNAERSQMLATAQGVSFPFALLIGPVSSGFLIDLNGKYTTMFAPFYAGALLEVVAGVLVLFCVPELHKESGASSDASAALTKSDSTAGDEVKVQSGNWRRHVYLTWVAAFFAEIGEGALNHVQNIGFIRYPWVGNNFRWVFMLFSVVVMVALPMALNVMQRSPAIAAALFRWISAILLGLIVLPTSVVPYLFLVYLHYSFKIAGQVSADNMVVDLTPAEERDKMIGYDKAINQFFNGISPFLFIPMFLDNEKWGPYPKGCNAAEGMCFVSQCASIYPKSLCGKFPEGTFLIATAVATLFAGFVYVPLFKRFPWKPLEMEYKPTEEETAAKEAYDKAKDEGGAGDVSWLSSKDYMEVNLERAKNGLPPVEMPFGTFDEDRSAGQLEKIKRYAKRDFEYMSKQTSVWVYMMKHGTPEEKKEIMMFIESMMSADPPTDADKKPFLEWLWLWLQYAGYGNPSQSPRVWKAIFMTVFPFILENGEHNPEFKEKADEVFMKAEHIMSGLLKMERANEKALNAASNLSWRSIRIRGL